VTLWKAQKGGGDERDNQEESEAEIQYYFTDNLIT